MKVRLMSKSQTSFLAAVLAMSTAFQSWAPALSFRLPVGTVQAEKRLEPAQPTEEDVNDTTYELTDSPCVVSMVKLLAHYLQQQVYLGLVEPTPNSISIIPLLIKIMAASKLQDKSLVVRREKSQLSLPAPVINTDSSVSETKAKAKPGKKTSKLSIGQKTPVLDELDPEETVRKEQERKNRSIASESLYDSKNLEAKPPEETTEHNKIKTANLYSTFMAPTVGLNPPKENMQFLFWTCPLTTTNTTIAKDTSSETKFAGSFVVSQHGTRFKSVHGRQFTLDAGKLLACNRQADLSFITSFGQIALPAGTSAIISADKDNLSVEAIESSGKSTVAISLKDGKKLYLANGQQLTLGADGKPTVGQFSVQQLIQKERLIDSQASYLNHEQASALADLIQRISVSTTATGNSGQ